ncbi:transglutaminase-like domain-containing protein [Luteimonas aquatica]|uniref:transglutaminase-like domain-containing protein n=1 Tax=Luteimonas aquatica TaxID=450364 RepID=UPI003CE4D281
MNHTLANRTASPGAARGRRLAALLAAVALGCFAAQSAAPLPEVIAAVDAGRFQDAEAQIAAALGDPAVSPAKKRDYAFQRERMRRILLDFSLDEQGVRERVRKQIPDLTEAEFARWNAAGLFERMTIDGRTVYFNRAPSNLFRLSPEAAARRDPALSKLGNANGPMESPNPHHSEVRDAALAQGRRHVAPRRLQVTQSLTVDADAVPAGETVRAWIPYPRALPGQQEHLRFLTSEPARHRIAPESALQRTVYLEKPARKGQPTAFSITYELTVYGQYVDIDPEKVVPAKITPELAPYLAERPPHVVFTDVMRLYSAQAVGDEKNPYRIARKLFDAVDRIPWAGAREYSTISNIGDYTLHAGHGDCGQQTLLLITLLRMNGIPARWQSGWIYSDGGYDNMHDWGWLYLAPYGWVPMDVTFGRLHGDGSAESRAVENFYLGGFDAYRIAFNDDYGRDFVPPKRFERSETVDLQRGEAEWRGGNLYFDQWDYHFAWKMLPPPGDGAGGEGKR